MLDRSSMLTVIHLLVSVAGFLCGSNGDGSASPRNPDETSSRTINHAGTNLFSVIGASGSMILGPEARPEN